MEPNDHGCFLHAVDGGLFLRTALIVAFFGASHGALPSKQILVHHLLIQDLLVTHLIITLLFLEALFDLVPERSILHSGVSVVALLVLDQAS